MNSTNKSGIYIHIPFCIKKCKYCDFLSFECNDFEAYTDALIRETDSLEYKKEVDSIFFGGGTPTLLGTEKIKRVLERLYERFNISDDCEITIEANPGTVKKADFAEYKKMGINRVSIGLQSANNEELKVLGRIHTYEEFLKSYDYMRSAGINNINIDIMSAVPNQTIASYEKTLNEVVKLKPEHISSYSLIIEEGTPFYKMEEEGKLILPSEEDERKMYHMTKQILAENSYNRYEISNYSIKGFESRHNIKYWERKEYLGLGLGASSLIDETRYNNITSFKDYIKDAGYKDIIENVCNLSEKDIIEEYMYLGLRLMKGIDSEDFERRFGRTLEKVYGNVIKKSELDNLLEYRGKSLVLTEFGVDVSNRVLSEFLLDILN